MPSPADVLVAESLTRVYRARGGAHRSRSGVAAVRDVSLRVGVGEILGVVGESGSGKSTLARLLTRLDRPDAGTVHVDGIDLHRARGPELRRMRRTVQMIFQDPYSSLDPRQSVAEAIGEVFAIHPHLVPPGRRAIRVGELMDVVGLADSIRDRYPADLSGGQRQRVGIARALAVNPRVLVADEPVSALDVSVQAQVINLIADLRRDLGLACMFIAHDLAVVRHIADRVAVMYRGEIVEHGTATEVLRSPAHPYTTALLAAAPRITRRGRPGQDG